MRKILLGSLCLLVACERTALSPVEIKLDNGIGGFATTSSINNTYTVRNGETLFDIANEFNIDPMSLARVNNIKVPYNVHKGQILKLPIEGDVGTDQQPKASYSSVDLRKSSEQDMKELDAKFEKMIRADSAKSEKKPSKVEQSEGGFNQQARDLLSPKITSTATGAKIKKESPASSGKMVKPVDGKVISKFGDNLDGIPNDGINVKAAAGTTVKVISDGEVLYAGNNLDESFGNVPTKRDKMYAFPAKQTPSEPKSCFHT